MTKFELAITDARAGRTERALASLNDVLRDEPENADALGHRAWMLRGLGRYEESERDYQQYMRLRPADDHARVMFADLLRITDRAKSGLDLCFEVLAKDPLNAAAGETLCKCQAALGAVKQVPVADLYAALPGQSLNPVADLLEAERGKLGGSVEPEVGRLLYGLVRTVQPKIVVETGCFIGYSTICLAQALKDNGAGYLHSFDAFRIREGYISPVIGACDEPEVAARGHIESAQVSDFVSLHKGDSAELVPEVIGPLKQPIDFAFIDADHTLKGCLADWNAVAPLLRPGGIVVLHDTEPNLWMGPHFLLENIQTEDAGDYHWIALPSPNNLGVGIVQKRSASDAKLGWKPSIHELLFEAVALKRHWGWFRMPKNF